MLVNKAASGVAEGEPLDNEVDKRQIRLVDDTPRRFQGKARSLFSEKVPMYARCHGTYPWKCLTAHTSVLSSAVFFPFGPFPYPWCQRNGRLFAKRGAAS